MLLAVLEPYSDESVQGRSGKPSGHEKGHNARAVYAQEGGIYLLLEGVCERLS